MDLNQSLHCAIIKGDVSEVQTLVERGASVNTTSYPDNWSPLHYAALLNRPDVMQLLIKGNADVNVVDKNDETALHVAFFHDNIPAAELLIQHGSSLQSQNIEGRRPFEVAVIDRPHNHRKRVNFEVIQTGTIDIHVQFSFKI
ncbi:uncharacterized protein [Mytilus edulis]|uniref:uncharacterized protein n=1 Tax=Mytilus edulis TaxID=6550 RepID=UPI0039F0049F